MGVDDLLIKNAQKTIDRLIRQLAEIEQEENNLEEDEYRELREDTVNQLQEYGKIVERLQGGDVSLIDDLTATKIAIRTAISKAFKTPEIMALFAGKHTGLLREKLMMTETNYRSQKMPKQGYLERKFEILMALRRLEETLTEDERKFLSDRLETPEFQLIEANANRLFSGNVVQIMASPKKPKKVRLDDKTENVSPPWKAWWHTEKKRKFYTNDKTKESLWDHPNTRKNEEKSPVKAKTRKRKDVEENIHGTMDDDKMEVDVVPPPKRKSMEKLDDEEFSWKRPRRSDSSERITKKEDIPSCSGLQVESHSNKMLPRVPWSSEVRPFKDLHYRACAIFDTCALLGNPDVLNASIEKQILTVIPYFTLSELDGLKNGSGHTRIVANCANNSIKDLLEEKNQYLHVETSTEQQIQINGFSANTTVVDDLILRTALRIKREIMSIPSTMNLNDRAIILVTEDVNLSNKALTHDLHVETVKSFMDTIHGRKKQQTDSDQLNSSRKSSNSDRRQTTRKEHHANSHSNKYTSNDIKYKRNEAVKSVKKHRELESWINDLAKKDAGRNAGFVKENKVEAPRKSRPSIPLADEITLQPSSSNSESFKPRKTYPSSTYQSSQNGNVVKTTKPNSNRPKIPLSLSDDECTFNDNMDCS